ncbi:MAG: type IV pilus assembly protein PilM [Candidatus Kuenenbacteria bacterium]
MLKSLLFKEQSYLGIDIGMGSIKIVELKNEKGKPKLVTYGLVEQSVDIVHDNSEEAKKHIANLILKTCEKAQVSTQKVITGLPTFSVFNSIINLPQISSKDLPSAIKWEAKKFIPLPLEEVILDWKILKEESSKEEKNLNINKDKSQSVSVEKIKKTKKGLRILLTVAPRSLIKKFVDIFKQINFELLSLETASFALTRSLLGYDLNPIMIVDIGAAITSVIVVEKNIPILNRSIDIGGISVTKTIANSLNINFKRAEQFKRDIGVSNVSSQEGTSNIVQNILNNIINEIRYTIELYEHQGSKKIEKIILTGGSAYLPNLPDFFSKVLEKKVYIGDPWFQTIYPLELKPALEEIAPRLSVAIGLAMREI